MYGDLHFVPRHVPRRKLSHAELLWSCLLLALVGLVSYNRSPHNILPHQLVNRLVDTETLVGLRTTSDYYAWLRATYLPALAALSTRRPSDAAVALIGKRPRNRIWGDSAMKHTSKGPPPFETSGPPRIRQIRAAAAQCDLPGDTAGYREAPTGAAQYILRCLDPFTAADKRGCAPSLLP